MSHYRQTCKPVKRAPKPLNADRLRELALAYLARFATSTGKLEAYLARKLRERGWEGEGEPDLPALVARMAQAGYIDDEAYARSKGEGLLRRGYGPRRVREALRAAGIGEELRPETGEAARRQAALTLARKRRFGPFGADTPDPARREKQIAAMLRAGHTLDSAREMVDAASIAAAERWVAESVDDEEG